MGWVPCIEFAHAYDNLSWVLSLMLQRSVVRSKKKLLPTLMKLRKERPLWIPRSQSGPAAYLLDDIKENAIVMNWIESDRIFRSPPKWPDLVYGAFKWRLIPSPVEVGSIDMRFHYLSSGGTRLFEHCVLLAYCFGFRVSDLSEHLDISEKMIETHMFHAISYLFAECPSFIVWATATDFRNNMLPISMFAAVGNKVSVLHWVRRSPFLFKKETLKPWVESPRMLTHLIYYTTKKPRLSTTYRDNLLTEARHAPEEKV